MSRKSAIVRPLLVLLIAVASVAVVMGAGRLVNQSIQDRVAGDRVLSRVQIINLNDTIARVDTANGEVHLFSGDSRSPSSRGQWRLYADGVRNSSGYLEVQLPLGVEARGTAFLVDVVTGQTWVLTRRSGRATWDPVPIFNR